MPRERDDEDDDYRDRRRRRRDEADDAEFDDDYRPRARRSERDDRPGSGGKPGLATTAGALWAVWCVFCLLAAAGAILFVVQAEADDRPGVPEIYTPATLCSAVFVLLTAGVCAVAALRTLTGQSRSLTAFAVLSVVCGVVVIFVRTLGGFVVGLEMEKEMRGGPPFAAAMAVRGFVFSAVLMSGVMLAGLFAFLANGRYREWRRNAGS